jgi:hypothetical protein
MRLTSKARRAFGAAASTLCLVAVAEAAGRLLTADRKAIEADLRRAFSLKHDELRRLLTPADGPVARKRARLLEALHENARYGDYQQSTEKILKLTTLTPDQKAQALIDLRSSYQRTFDDAAKESALDKSDFEPARRMVLKPSAISAELTEKLARVSKRVFTPPFAGRVEWKDVNPDDAAASLVTSADSATGAYDTLVLFADHGSAATGIYQAATFQVPTSVAHIALTATIEVQGSGAYGTPESGYMYCLTTASLRVFSADYAVNVPDAFEAVVELQNHDPSSPQSLNAGAKTFTLETDAFPVQTGADYIATAGGEINVIGDGVAFVTLRGVVKKIVVHYVD